MTMMSQLTRVTLFVALGRSRGSTFLPFGTGDQRGRAEIEATYLIRFDMSFTTLFPFPKAFPLVVLDELAVGVASTASEALLLRLYLPSSAADVRGRFKGGWTVAGGGVGERSARFLPLRSTGESLTLVDLLLAASIISQARKRPPR